MAQKTMADIALDGNVIPRVPIQSAPECGHNLLSASNTIQSRDSYAVNHSLVASRIVRKFIRNKVSWPLWSFPSASLSPDSKKHRTEPSG